MAGIDYARAGEPAPDVTGISTIVNITGTVVSVALMVGVGIWGYRLVSRDVTGVPVVQALEGPMRVAPREPGGRPADHQGLAVNHVAARGSVAAPTDRMVLAPGPVRLLEEDQPAVQTGGAAHTGARAEAEVDGAEVAAPVPRSAQGVEPLEQTEAVAVVTGPAPARSLRPRARSARVAAALTAAAGGAAATVALDVNAGDVPTGTRLAQLGAYKSEEIALAEWQRLFGRFGDYMDGKQRVIQKVSSGGRTLYRLRVMGFEDLSDARGFCAVLMAENADCIAVTTR